MDNELFEAWDKVIVAEEQLEEKETRFANIIWDRLLPMLRNVDYWYVTFEADDTVYPYRIINDYGEVNYVWAAPYKMEPEDVPDLEYLHHTILPTNIGTCKILVDDDFILCFTSVDLLIDFIQEYKLDVGDLDVLQENISEYIEIYNEFMGSFNLLRSKIA